MVRIPSNKRLSGRATYDHDDDAKPRLETVDTDEAPPRAAGLTSEEAEFLRQFGQERAKAVTRKIDARLVPIMALLYLLSHIDRGNLGNAKIEGMDQDLGLKGNQYNIASTIFFVPYIIFEIPSNMVLKRVRPSIWLSLLIICWGIVMTCMGVVHSFREMIVCRVLLGFFEAGFFPGAVFVVSSWYPRHQLQQRLALFYTASAFSGALSGLLAYGIARMDGLRGYEGWRWIFLIEGAITVATGLFMPLLVVDTPEQARWLAADEKRFVDLTLRRSGVRAQTGEDSDAFSWKMLLTTMLDWKIWLGIVIAWANSVPNAAFKFTLPQIVNQLGFSTANSQLLTIPPYFCGGVAAWVMGRFADHATWRMPFIVGPMTVLVVALAVLFSLSSDVANNVPGMYVGIVLSQIGIYPLLPGISAWTGNNLAPSWRRSIGLAWLLAAGNIGSLIGTNIFLDSEAPNYPTGYGVSLGIICLGMLAALTLEFLLWNTNKARATLSLDDVHQAYTQTELDALGDKGPLYQYTL